MYRDNILKANKVMNKLLYLLLIAVCWSCSQDSETEKHQSKRDQVVDVRDKMKEFSTQDVLIKTHSNILPAVHIRDKVRMRLQL